MPSQVSRSNRAIAGGGNLELAAWIDTGFTGDLVLPQAINSKIGLTQSGTADAQLGDGSLVLMNVYSCVVTWFGQARHIEAVANQGVFPLIGVGMLKGKTLTVDYSKRIVRLTAAGPGAPITR